MLCAEPFGLVSMNYEGRENVRKRKRATEKGQSSWTSGLPNDCGDPKELLEELLVPPPTHTHTHTHTHTQ